MDTSEAKLGRYSVFLFVGVNVFPLSEGPVILV